MGFKDEIGQMAAAASGTSTDSRPEVLHDSPCDLRWSCVNFFSSLRTMWEKKPVLFGIPGGIRPAPADHRRYTLLTPNVGDLYALHCTRQIAL